MPCRFVNRKVAAAALELGDAGQGGWRRSRQTLPEKVVGGGAKMKSNYFSVISFFFFFFREKRKRTALGPPTEQFPPTSDWLRSWFSRRLYCCDMADVIIYLFIYFFDMYG